MPDITVTVTEPTAADVIDIRIRCDGAGNLKLVTALIKPPVDDESGTFDPNITMDHVSFTTGITNAITTLVNQALAEYKTKHGF